MQFMSTRPENPVPADAWGLVTEAGLTHVDLGDGMPLCSVTGPMVDLGRGAPRVRSRCPHCITEYRRLAAAGAV